MPNNYVTVTPDDKGWRPIYMKWDKHTETHKETIVGPSRESKEAAMDLAHTWARVIGRGVEVKCS